MKERSYLKPGVLLCLLLMLLSALFYAIRFVIFHDAQEIFSDLLDDIGFVFIEILLASVIIHQILSEWSRRSMLRKLHMVIGAFFSEIGTELLVYFSNYDPNLNNICDDLVVKDTWCHQDFVDIRHKLESHKHDVEIDKIKLDDLRDFLAEKRIFLLRILQNPNLLEHETFTELLQAVFHLTEELVGREDLLNLGEADAAHIAIDIKRAYSYLIKEWVVYMEHLKGNYPYFFSYAMRTNPFDKDASIIVH